MKIVCWMCAAAMACAQELPFRAEIQSPNTLVIGKECSTITPCLARIGQRVIRFTEKTTLVAGAGSGTVRIYLSAAGRLTAGHNLKQLSCSGCAVAGGEASFPLDALPLWTWDTADGKWAVTGLDERAALTLTVLSGDAGVRVERTPERIRLDVPPEIVGRRAPAPASANSACTPGEWAADANYFYVCIADKSWRRAALSSW